MKNKKLVAAFISFTCLASMAATNPAKDGAKLDEQLKKISLVASDMDGRRVVNRVMAKELGVPRKQLVDERKSTQFVYGQIFAIHEIARLSHSSFAEVAKEAMNGKSPLAISMEREIDLKKILKDAKKINSKLDSELAAVADGEESEIADDQADGYDPGGDAQPGDTSGLTAAEVSQARQYVRQPPGLAARVSNMNSRLNAGANGGGISRSGSGSGNTAAGARGASASGGRGGGPH